MWRLVSLRPLSNHKSPATIVLINALLEGSTLGRDPVKTKCELLPKVWGEGGASRLLIANSYAT